MEIEFVSDGPWRYDIYVYCYYYAPTRVCVCVVEKSTDKVNDDLYAFVHCTYVRGKYLISK